MRRLAALTCLVPLALSLAPAATASAEETTNQNRFSLTAEGNGMFFEYRGQAAPATDNVSASPWASFATVNSQGLSRAFAGLPYFGAFLQTIPGTVNGLSGGATPPLPPLPGYTETKFPAKPEGHQNQGPYSVRARSDQYASEAAAKSGFSPDADSPRQQIFSSAKSVANGDGSVTSIATAGVQAFTMGPLSILRFGNEESITESGNGKPVFHTATDLGTFEVAGVKVGVTQDGFVVGSTPTGLPASEALSTVNTVLANAGMEIAYIPRTITKDTTSGVTSVLSGALRVRMFQDVPAEGPTTLTYVFGRATVSSSDVVDQGYGVELPVDLPAVDVPTVPAVPADAGSVVDVPVTAPIDTGSVTPPADLGSGLSVDTPAVAGGPVAPQRVLGLVRSVSGGQRGNSSSLFYLVLVLAGAGVLVGQQVFSRFGIRLLLRAT